MSDKMDNTDQEDPGADLTYSPLSETSAEELMAMGVKAQRWNRISLGAFLICLVGMLSAFQLTELVAVRAIVALVMIGSAAAVMGTTMWVFSLRTERKRRGLTGQKSSLSEDETSVKDAAPLD